MKNLILILSGVLFLSCGSTKSGMTNQEFDLKINEINELNLKEMKLANGWYETSFTPTGFHRTDEKTSSEFHIKPKPIVLVENFSKVKESTTERGEKVLTILLDKPGAAAWSEATARNVSLSLIFIFEDQIKQSPVVQEQIFGGVTALWKNNFSEEEWSRIKEKIKK